MQTASLNGVFEILVFIIAFYYAIKLVARIFLPMLVKKAVEKAGENFSQQQKNRQRANTGNSTFQQATKPDKPRETKKVGEYVDFEEID